jgi:hypothetical protein
MRLLSTAFLLLVTGCTGAIEPLRPAPIEVPAITIVSGAPTESTRPQRTTEGAFTAPTALWLQEGAPTVLDGQRVSRRDGPGFKPLTIGTPEDARTPGAIRAATPRHGGVFLAGTEGFFHDAPGRLLRSPLSDAFAMESVRFVDFTGGALWVTTANEAVRVLNGRREAVRIADPEETGALQAVVGRTATTALVVQGASLYSVDLSTRAVTTLARTVPTVTALSHRGEVVLLGTTEGLVEVSADDVVKRRTLAAAGGTAAAIVDVEAVGGTSLVSTSRQVLHVTEASAVILADVTQPWPDSLAKDPSGDVWFLDGTSVVRLSTSVAPPAPSFATDVKPFMAAHCRSCHSSGANYAPVLDLENYGVAKTWAQASLRRITDPLSPMPPASAEILTPAQYDIVVRWVDGGLLP